MFADYIDWRADHPSDDIMTELLQAEFEDENGVVRRLTREELLTYIDVIAGAGNETTSRLIGWTGKVLADHPDQRRELVEDRSLIPNAIEELLRFETPAPHAARYVTRDVELYGETVPEGSIMMLLPGSANHDDRRFPDGDSFDIHRSQGKSLTFGYGIHLCLGVGAGPPRRQNRPRGGPQSVPHLGGRHGPGQARSDLDRPWVGDTAGRPSGEAADERQQYPDERKGLVMGELDDKVAVITGAGSGMAKASVKVFVREGAKVVAADISGAEVDTAKEVEGDVLPVHCDVTQEDDVEALMATAVKEFGRIDAVLNVAGVADGAQLVGLDMAMYDRLMDVNLRGVFLGMKYGIRAMLESGGGSVVNWSSVGGLNGNAHTAVYNASKHAVIGASKSAAIEYGPRGVRVERHLPGLRRGRRSCPRTRRPTCPRSC